MMSIIKNLKPALLKVSALLFMRGLLIVFFAWLLQLGIINAQFEMLLFVVLILKVLIENIARRYLASLALKMKFLLRESIHKAIFTSSIQVGEVLTLCFEAVEAVEDFIIKVMPILLSMVTLLPTILIAALILDPLSALILLLTFPIAPLILWLIGSSLKLKVGKTIKGIVSLNFIFRELLAATTTFKLFSVAGNSYVEKTSKDSGKATLDMLKFVFVSAFALELLTTLSIAVLAVTVGLRLVDDAVSFEAALFILLLAPEFFAPIRQLGTSYHLFINAREALGRIEQHSIRSCVDDVIKSDVKI